MTVNSSFHRGRGSGSEFSLGFVVDCFSPVTWAPSVWAFVCGTISTAIVLETRLLPVILGLIVAGPLVGAVGRAANDWFNQHADAIAEPDRPSPSGRLAGRWGLYLAIMCSLLALIFGAALGSWAFGATGLAVASIWVFGAKSVRLKRFGWLGAVLRAIRYVGLPWFIGAAVMMGTIPDAKVILMAALYTMSAVGIMIFNDFETAKEDRRIGIRTVPVQLGFSRTAMAYALMIVAQSCVIMLLAYWNAPLHSLGVGALLLAQVALMSTLHARSSEWAIWNNAFGILIYYVLGMILSALALAQIV